MRDPLLYRIRHATHYRRGDAWCSIRCTISPTRSPTRSRDHALHLHARVREQPGDLRLLVDNLFPEPRPRQYEFARLNLDYTVMSKRKLLQLVEEGLVSAGTIRACRRSPDARRGYAPEGIAYSPRASAWTGEQPRQHGAARGRDPGRPECRAPRAMAVLRPLKVTITNWPDDRVEGLEIPLWPKDTGKEGRARSLTREIRIERTDFSPDPPPTGDACAGSEARLMGGYYIRCDEVVLDPATGGVAELRCSYDPESLGAPAKGERKKTTAIHVGVRCARGTGRDSIVRPVFTVADPESVEEGRRSRNS